MGGIGMNFSVKIYNAAEIGRLRSGCQFYSLEFPEEVFRKSDEELVRVCNGVGPDDWSAALRKALTKLFGNYEVAAFVHDIRFEYLIGDCDSADLEFKRNLLRIWRKHYGWRRFIWPAAWVERRALLGIYALLRMGSQKAWEAVKKRKEADYAVQ